MVLVPSGEDTPSPFAGEAVAEIADFHGSAFDVFADESSVAAFVPNPLNPACRIPSARAGGTGPPAGRGRRGVSARVTHSSRVGGVPGLSMEPRACAASSCPASITSAEAALADARSCKTTFCREDNS